MKNTALMALLLTAYLFIFSTVSAENIGSDLSLGNQVMSGCGDLLGVDFIDCANDIVIYIFDDSDSLGAYVRTSTAGQLSEIRTRIYEACVDGIKLNPEDSYSQKNLVVGCFYGALYGPLKQKKSI